MEILIGEWILRSNSLRTSDNRVSKAEELCSLVVKILNKQDNKVMT